MPSAADDVFVANLHAWAAVLPAGTVFTHLTAARAFGWWLPPVPDDLPVHAATVVGRSASARPGVRVSRHKVQPGHVDCDGLRLALAPEVLLACAQDVGLIDLVVLVTSALRSGSCTRDEVESVAATTRRGSRRLRKALELSDCGCESAWEVLLRLLHVTCEIQVEAQHEVVVILRDADESLGRLHRPERVRAWHRLLRESLFTPAGTEIFRRRLGLAAPSEELGA